MKLQVNGQRLDIARPPWLFARTARFAQRAALVVYKSPMLREVSGMYAPVLAFLGDNQVHVHRHGVFLDADMMFGRGELTVYLTEAFPHPDDDDLSDIEIPGVQEN